MIFVECNPDLTLVRLTKQIPKSQIVHELKGKGEICKKLNANRNSIALLDEDPFSYQPSYLSTMQNISRAINPDIKVLYDPNKNNLVVLLIPRLEEWVIKATRLANLNVRTYNLSGNASELHREINYKIDRFEDLVEDLIKARCQMMVSLKQVL